MGHAAPQKDDMHYTVCNTICEHLDSLVRIIQSINQHPSFAELEDMMRHHAFDVIDWARMHNSRQDSTSLQCNQVASMRLSMIESILEGESSALQTPSSIEPKILA